MLLGIIFPKDICDLGGKQLLNKYNGSPSLLLSTMYPDYDWLIWKFDQVPKNFWHDNKNKRKFFDCVGKQLGINNFQEWQKVLPSVYHTAIVN